jgi:hypothetical protein
MHLSYSDLELNAITQGSYRFVLGNGREEGKQLDDHFFYSVPTSFFVLDKRVPEILRDLLTEAEGSLKSNFLTGASACARKLVYELGKLSKAAGDSYEDRIKALKVIHKEVDGAYFDTLLTVQELTSSKVHENAYDGWESKHLQVILRALADVLHEIYVAPALRKDRRQELIDLKQKLLGKSERGKEAAAVEQDEGGKRTK